jgi:ADP-heptose:LPS heptosyltransferase
MNFPGLDALWSGVHRAVHGFGLLRTWSLEETRTRLAEGEKVLVVATTALGDSLLTTPLVETLAHHLGRERVSLVVKAPYADLYKDDPRLHCVFTVRGKYRWEGLRGQLRADPHRIALLANFTEPDLVPELWHSGVRGFLRYRSRWTRYPRWMANASMLRRPGDPGYASGHAIENNLAMAEALGMAPSTHRLAVPQVKHDEKAPHRMVTIHPGASRANKRWSVLNWARLADALKQKLEVGISYTGDRSEHGLVEQIIDQMSAEASSAKRPAVNAAGIMSLSLLAIQQDASAAFISGDTGPYHLALAVGCPTVTLFAPTDRGSSIEACGPHQVDPVFHRAIQTANFGDSIATIPFEQVLAETLDVVEKSLARGGRG